MQENFNADCVRRVEKPVALVDEYYDFDDEIHILGLRECLYSEDKIEVKERLQRNRGERLLALI